LFITKEKKVVLGHDYVRTK